MNKTQRILKIMKILSWVVFIGLCIKAGAIVISFLLSLFMNPEAAKNLYLGIDLSNLYNNNLIDYFFTTLLMITCISLQAYLFYMIIKILNRVNFTIPFTEEIGSIILKMSFVCLGMGMISLGTKIYLEKLIRNQNAFPNLFEYINGPEVYFFMAGIIFIIGQIFFRGLELQKENDLTV